MCVCVCVCVREREREMYSDEQGMFLIAMAFEVCFMENCR